MNSNRVLHLLLTLFLIYVILIPADSAFSRGSVSGVNRTGEGAKLVGTPNKWIDAAQFTPETHLRAAPMSRASKTTVRSIFLRSPENATADRLGSTVPLNMLNSITTAANECCRTPAARM